jgi:small-conductance mechanosensitive channel
MTVWDSFHANGIEIPFLQRESHIKSIAPLEISQDSHPPFAIKSPTNEQQLEKF